MMARTQISLKPDAHRRARARAAALGISLAEYMRRLVDRDLSDEVRPSVDVSVLFNLGDSGGSDVAKHKHEYIGDAVDAAHPRR
jgi:hypothetical protein